MNAKIFKYLSAFSFGISFTYFTLDLYKQSATTLFIGLLSIG